MPKDALYEDPAKKRRRRLWHRLQSGIKWHYDDDLGHLVLSTPPNRDPEQYATWFDCLVKAIKRLTPMRLYRMGFISLDGLKKYYRGKPIDEVLKFDYTRVRTCEGNGTFHVTFFGDFIPKGWLDFYWDSLTGHDNTHTYIRKPPSSGSSRWLVNYILGQYVGDQDAIINYSMSSGWVRKGFVRLWKALIHNEGFFSAVALWDFFLTNHRLPKWYGRFLNMRLDEFVDVAS